MMKNETKAIDHWKVQSSFTTALLFFGQPQQTNFCLFRKKVKVEESNYFVCLTTVLKGQF